MDQTCIWILVYVDDILVIGNDSKSIHSLITDLNTVFALKDLGEIHHFLGIETTHTKTGLHLCQDKYIKDLLHKAKMLDTRSTATPMITSLQLSKDQGAPTVDGTMYRSIVG